MKKLSVIALLLISIMTANAQHQINPYFESNGTVRLETQELYDGSDKLISVSHRADDIVWSRIVYRVIDMRYKQNYQLYFPIRPTETDYKNLFSVIQYATYEGLPIYEKTPTHEKPLSIKPKFTLENRLSNEETPPVFCALNQQDPAVRERNALDPTMFDISNSNYMYIRYDSIEGMLKLNTYGMEDFFKNQLKYLIQEIVFFDKHTSRLYSKIIAIAPLHADLIYQGRELVEAGDKKGYMTALSESIMFWVLFDDLRPFLARQYVIPQGNDTKRVTFEEFFAKRLYTSYLVGESNTYDRMFLDYAETEEEVKKEQQRVADELLNFEQDLWEY